MINVLLVFVHVLFFLLLFDDENKNSKQCILYYFIPTLAWFFWANSFVAFNANLLKIALTSVNFHQLW